MRPVRFLCTWPVHIAFDSRGHSLCASYAVLVHASYVILVRFLYNQDILPDDSSLCLGIEMVEILMALVIFGLKMKNGKT